jgi:peptidoglycan/xylan/chitin deacetylase (PgdA/CDA1 family)
MTTQVLFTIDTELTWRHYARGADWRENLALSYDAAGAGVPYQLEVLKRHGLKACFFVDPMPAALYGLEPVERMVAPILAAGQEVQLHLHPCWAEVAAGRGDDARFELNLFPTEEQRALIETARDFLIAAEAPPPIAFRAGSYAANRHTLAALAALGIRYDSSHNGAERPTSALPFPRELLDPARHGRVIEIPVSQIGEKGGGLRPLQVCALSGREMHMALRHAARHGHRTATIVCHSFELATRDGKRVNKLVRGRFDRLCAFLAANAESLPTARFDALGRVTGHRVAQPLPPQGLRTAERMAEQAWGAARYEKPMAGAALAALPPIVAFEEIVALAGL